MNKMTSKEYLIDITLKSLEVNKQSRAATKVMCQIHYGEGDSYLRIKMQPVLKNGLASFYEERIRIPYSAEIALVFKIFKAKKEIFLGHYTIEAEKYLQEKIYSMQLKEKLEQADAWADFEVKIIDKQLFYDDESDCLDDDDLFPATKSNYSEDFRSIAKMSDYKAKSELNTPFLIIKKDENMLVPMPPNEFQKNLLVIDDLLQKHRMMYEKQHIVNQLKKGPDLKNSTINQLQLQLTKAKHQKLFNEILIMGATAFLGLVCGFII